MKILILTVVLLGVPLLAGGIFADAGRSCCGLLSRWVSGQMLLWAGFELISVPMILMGRGFAEVAELFCIYSICVLALALVSGLSGRARRKRTSALSGTSGCKKNLGRKMIFASSEMEGQESSFAQNRTVAKSGSCKGVMAVTLWGLAASLLLVQLVLACLLTYEEGDDAFYVGITTDAAESETMYRTLPYTGLSTSMDIRHALAPFPIWVSFLARISGMHGVTVAQIVLPVVLITMCYGIYYMIGTRLFRKGSRKLPLFMLLLECLVLFGGYSLYTAENFLLVRTAQGKAVIASIIIPFLFLLFLMLLEKVQNGKKAGGMYWLLVACAMVAGDLCSTQGIQLTGMLLGVLGGCTAAAYRRWKLLFPMAGCCVVPGALTLLYLWLSMTAPA